METSNFVSDPIYIVYLLWVSKWAIACLKINTYINLMMIVKITKDINHGLSEEDKMLMVNTTRGPWRL
jgi:hypothetical protein